MTSGGAAAVPCGGSFPNPDQSHPLLLGTYGRLTGTGRCLSCLRQADDPIHDVDVPAYGGNQ